MKISTKRMVLIAMMAAICFVGTWLHIPIPIGGATSMVHLGTTAIFIAAVLIGPDAGLAAGIGCALFDAMDPAFAVWVIPTLIVKGATGYIAGKIAFSNNKNGEDVKLNVIGFIAGGVVSLLGYFIFNWILFKGWYGAVLSLSTSIGTTAIGLAIAIPLSVAVKKSTARFIQATN